MRLALLTCSAPCVGWPPLMRRRPSASRTTPGSSGSRLWKSSPCSGALSNTGPDSMSLIDTGCTLSVGDGALARTSTGGGTKASGMSSSTCAVSGPRTVNAADWRSMNPGREAMMTYWPGGTSGNVTCPTPSVSVLAMASLPPLSRSSTVTPDICTEPSSVVMVATTRPSVACSSWPASAGDGSNRHVASRLMAARTNAGPMRWRGNHYFLRESDYEPGRCRSASTS